MQARKCSFCKINLPHGTGKMLVKKDGSTLFFCSSKCEKNLLKLKRSPRRMKWVRTDKKRATKKKTRVK